MKKSSSSVLLISNVNLEPIHDHPAVPPIPISIHYDGFNTLGRRLSENLDQVAVDYDWVWIHADLNYPGLIKGDYRNADISKFREETILMLEQWLERMAAFPNIRFILSSFSFHSLWNRGQSIAQTQLELNYHFNHWLSQRIPGHPNIVVFPFDQLVINLGESHCYDPRLWNIGRIPYSYPFLSALKSGILRHISATTVSPRKVLVLDLDNTLWGGTIDEQDSQPIQLDVEGTGLAYQNFQHSIQGLQQRGVLLAIISKNDEKEVDKVFKNHPHMVLKKDDFTEIIANWEAKSHNLRDLADRLGLSPDSFVMIDDNPRERIEISQTLPEVALPVFPKDPADIDKWFYEEVISNYFNFRTATREDKLRTGQYRARRKRLAAENRYANIENFLQSLEIRFSIGEAKPEDRTRVYQLLQRTNQFNLNKDPDMLRQSLEIQPDRKVWVLHYRDIFGVEGLVGVIIVNLKDAPTIESFAVSCRVLGKRVEHALLLKALENIDSPEITLLFQPTERNQQMAAFLSSIGYVSSGERSVIGPVTELIQTLREYVNFISHEPV